MGVSILLLTAEITHARLYDSFGESLRHVAFATISMATTTGLVTEDFSLWPVFASMWILFLSCVVSCTGSTGGVTGAASLGRGAGISRKKSALGRGGGDESGHTCRLKA